MAGSAPRWGEVAALPGATMQSFTATDMLRFARREVAQNLAVYQALSPVEDTDDL